MAVISWPQTLPRWRHFTLADGLALPQDNFLLLRTFAAVAVLYGHSYAMVAERGPPEVFIWMGWGTYSGAMAVDLFFLISGFLVTGSFLRRRNVLEFAWARALRVVPAYAVCLLGCAFVLGAIYTTLPLADYLGHSAVRHYVLTNLRFSMRMIWNLPGVFADNPRSNTINGSIWTLPAEVRMYLCVALAGALGILSRRAWCNLLLAGLFVVGLLALQHLPFVPSPAFMRLAGFFALGAFCYVNRDVVPASGWVFLMFAVLAWLLRNTLAYPFAFGLAEATFAFWFAYRTRWYGYNRVGDYSYGLYLWGYPAEQVIAHHFPTIAPLTDAALGFCLAAVLAVASWHFVEKPAIKLKSIPRKMWARQQRSNSPSATEEPESIGGSSSPEQSQP